MHKGNLSKTQVRSINTSLGVFQRAALYRKVRVVSVGLDEDGPETDPGQPYTSTWLQVQVSKTLHQTCCADSAEGGWLAQRRA